MVAQHFGSTQSGHVRFRLVAFNVQNLGREDHPEPQVLEHKLGYVSDVLRRLDGDITVVNEIREEDCFDELAAGPGTDLKRHLADASARNRHIQTGILSRFPILDAGQWVDFPVLPSGGPAQVAAMESRRPVPWVRVRLPKATRSSLQVCT